MRLLLVLLILLVPLVPQFAVAQTPPWDRVAAAHRVADWKTVEVLDFTFKHSKGFQRHHQWWVKKNIVRVTMDGKTIEIPFNAKDLKGDEQIAAHRAFINDSFWLLFEFHIQWDKPKLEDLGEYENAAHGGKARAFRVTYPAQGGYTPGDAYVAWLGEDDKVMAWSYFPGGAASAKLTSTRGSYQQFGPLILPTRVEKPDGELLLEFTDIAVR